ncbi:iron-responsive element-binding protein 2 isoform X2 [Talpa occidentalis]|uniref:iron-responsive element-binding protein 2 isoform X2 n=1 Tax=Talpa occidentalis TaxID=50954 RepID=UPI0023F9B7BE|nr:iron-responsive element-binding protein 2 isoform X2 [Talpa occidentalis]
MDAPRAGNAFEYLIETLSDSSRKKFFNVPKLGGAKYDALPFSIRVLLEAAVRRCDGFLVREDDALAILDWRARRGGAEVPFFPARVLLQDFTGIPAMVDLAAMREAVKTLGGDPGKVHPACPADLTVDHSLQIDFSKWPETVLKNQEIEFGRNRERLQFFKWSSRAFKDVAVIPPGAGMAHQVNLEFLSRVVFEEKDLLFPDSVLGTDSHITMVNGLGILGWGVGGIETEAVMLGLPVSLTLPEVVGCELTGPSNPFVTSIDVVLGITKHLRQAGVAGKFVEFFGSGVAQLSVVDRTTIANMCPEYGAVLSFFPVDNVTLKHLEHTGVDKAKLKSMETYLKAVKLFRNNQNDSGEPEYSQVIRINLNSIVPSVSGPKRPQDRVAVTDMKTDFQACLNEKVGFKGFQIAAEKQKDRVSICYEGREYELAHGSVVMAALNSCTNNCNPSVMLAAGLLAKKAVQAGLRVRPYIRTSLSPGSGMVTHYLSASGVLPYLSRLGFEVVGYGCSTCVGNTAPLSDAVLNAVKQGDLVTCGVLSGNKNFEGRLCDCVRASYLASPPLVVAYAIAGTVDIDFQAEPLGADPAGRSVYLRDVWPSLEEVHQVEEEHVILSMFKALKEKIELGDKRWNSLEAPESVLFPWDVKSTYIRCPSFFDKLTKEPGPLRPIEGAHVLLRLGDCVTTDHISPAGSIARSSAAAKYLAHRGLTPREFNSYGARRGNDAVMTRGTFANIKLLNKFIGKPAPKTIHFPSGQTLDVFEAAELYQKEGTPLIILAGKQYGSGSSRDWAAKGPYLLGVRAVLAESYEKIHKDHLVGVGIAPLRFLPGESADSLGLSGRETFSFTFPEELSPGVTVDVQTSTGKAFRVIASFENDVEIALYQHGGLLNFVARKFS